MGWGFRNSGGVEVQKWILGKCLRGDKGCMFDLGAGTTVQEAMEASMGHGP